jgi:hypothetical protein
MTPRREKFTSTDRGIQRERSVMTPRGRGYVPRPLGTGRERSVSVVTPEGRGLPRPIGVYGES